MYQLYSHINRDKKLRKLLLENSWNSLYLWIDDMDYIQKIQFDYRGDICIELSSETNIVRKINNDLSDDAFALIFNRALTSPTQLGTEIKNSIKEISFNLETDLASIKKSLLLATFISGIKVRGLKDSIFN